MVKKIAFSFFNTIGLTRYFRSQKKNTVTVLNLHRISPERDFFFNPITPSHFESLLGYVSKHYNVISFADIAALQNSPGKNRKPYLILSFDDGYYDFVEYALPLLVKYNLPSNHNIVNSCANTNEIIWTHRLNNIFNQAMERNVHLQFNVENQPALSLPLSAKSWTQFYFAVFKTLLNTPRTERMQWISEKEKELSTTVNCKMMNWDQVIECTKNRVEIGCHTYNHDSLSSITDYNVLLNEVRQSKTEMEEKIKKPIYVLALPNGQSNKDIEKACAASGISDILFVDDKVNELAGFSMDKINLVSRINISDEAPAEMFLRVELFHSKIRKYV